jgi:L-galactose dehydrogenase
MSSPPAALPRLPTRPLGGNTNLQVSVLGFGASPLGGVFGDVTEDGCRRAVHRAFSLGINLFDTSPYYGATRSETMLGKCLQGLPRDQIIVSTKVGRYGPEQKDFDFSAARVTASVAESLARLQLDYVDVVHCHDVEFGDLQQVLTEALPALRRLQREGKVRHVGVSGLPFKVFREVLSAAPAAAGTGEGAEEGSSSCPVDVVLSYCHFALNDK